MRCQFKLLRIIVHGFNLVMGLLGVLALGDRSAHAGFLSAGDHVITVRQADRERAAIVHVPVRATERRDIPVIINFHGGGGHGSNEQEYSLMDRFADRQMFLAVYPTAPDGSANDC
jgi:poly(3-hydroxybutyrate) depolymerase